MSFGHFENMTDSLNLRRLTNSPNYPVLSTINSDYFAKYFYFSFPVVKSALQVHVFTMGELNSNAMKVLF